MASDRTRVRAELGRLADASLGDLEAIRNLLQGVSVIDWHRLAFADTAEVDRFLRVNEFDKLRFRLITRNVDDLPAVLTELLHRLVPFNYVIPGESVNGVLPFRRLVEDTPAYARFADQLQHPLDKEEVARGSLGNEF